MLSNDIAKLKCENEILREALKELNQKMENGEVSKPKSCQYCKHYAQHYIKGGIAFTKEYVPIYEGHCTVGVPIKKGGKKKVTPEDTCLYFELGTKDMSMTGI